MSVKNCLKLLTILLVCAFFAGCATYGSKMEETRLLFSQGEYDEALKKLEKTESGSSKLLYLLERGMILHYASRYEESNDIFEEAEILAEDLYTKSVSKEVGAFLSGYDIKSITYTIDENDVLTLAVEPYGVPGDADGDGNPDASSDPAIFDEPGVGSTEYLSIGLVCADPAICVPDVNMTYSANTLTVDNPAAGPVSMAVTATAYELTIPDFTTWKTNLGSLDPTVFGQFSFSASFTDSQVDDFAPDLDASGVPQCDSVNIVKPDPGKDPFDCYHVNRVSVKKKDRKHGNGTKGRVKIQKAGFRLDPPNTVDMSTAMVQIRVDGLIVDFAEGDFVQKGNKPDFVFKSASGASPKITARLRFDKYSWDFSARGVDTTLIDKSDGIDVCLMIDNFESCQNVMVTKYGNNSSSSDSGTAPRGSCKPAGTGGGGGNSSDSGTPGNNKLSCLSSLTLQHTDGTLITKTRAAAELLHPNTVFQNEATGDMAIVHTSCSQALRCGDDVGGGYTIVEIEGTPGDKMARKCNVSDASCSILP